MLVLNPYAERLASEPLLSVTLSVDVKFVMPAKALTVPVPNCKPSPNLVSERVAGLDVVSMLAVSDAVKELNGLLQNAIM